MLDSPVRASARVISLDQNDFDAACAELMCVAETAFAPDVIVGIRTGGYYVAESMARAVGGEIPLLPITCRRPSTKYKPFSAFARKIVAGLPRPILDQLRVVEHRMLTRKPVAPAKPYHFDETELSALSAWFRNWPSTEPARVLIVDDSIDTGTTMLHVVDTLRKQAGIPIVLATAAVTVTTDRPLVMPDFVLLRQQLCRFPWSMDAGATPQRVQRT
jgi:hypoxanthine phosphoribosyltransferase